MSQENVEIVRRHVEAYLGPRPESSLDLVAADVEFDTTDRPDGKVWHGRDGVRRAMVEWTGTWRNWRAEITHYLELPDDRVLVLWREWGEGKSSGVPMEEGGGTLFTVRDGLIVQMKVVLGRKRAREAAGLPQKGVSRENAEIVRRIYEMGMLDRDPERLLPLLAPDVEYVNPPDAVEPGTRRGLSGMLRAMQSLGEAFDSSRTELRELFDAGVCVVAAVDFCTRSRGSDAEVVQEEAHTWTFRDGRIVRFEWGRDLKRALEAAGLRE